MDKKYQWNENILIDFSYQEADMIWTVPLIQGHLQQKIENLNNNQLGIMLISRRRQARGGVRFLQRGIDEQGNCANMVESEIILTYKEIIYSFV